MSEKPTVFAVAAHPDDIEFNMAGTLWLLAQAGYQPHMMNLSHSNLDSNELSEPEITAIRRAEAQRSAEVIGAAWHSPIANDLMIFYQDDLLRKLSAVVRQVRPRIVLLPSPADYMEDHTNTARLAVTACFSRAMKHYRSDPPQEPFDHDVFLYHAQPHMNRDGMRNLVVPELFVDITSAIDVKQQMLACHQSQRQWLDQTQGLDDYLSSMHQAGAEMAGLLGRPDCRFAEGFRQHNHLGFSTRDADPLSEALGSLAARRG